MGSRFEAQVDAWVRKSLRRQNAVVKSAAQELAVRANMPKAKGGRLPVDTAFLRSSFAAALNEVPIGPSQQFEGVNPEWEGEITLTIANASPGDVIFIGWTAEYARIAEARDGFMKGAALQWQDIVDEQTAAAKRRFR